jgi:hypothetical protein
MMLSGGTGGTAIIFAKAGIVPPEFLVGLVDLVLERGDRL